MYHTLRLLTMGLLAAAAAVGGVVPAPGQIQGARASQLSPSAVSPFGVGAAGPRRKMAVGRGGVREASVPHDTSARSARSPSALGTVTGSGTAISGTEGQEFTGTVAAFADSSAGDTPSDFTATIEWGDGTQGTGVVSGGGGLFTVSGSHTYGDEGTYGVTVTLTDAVGGSAVAVAHSTAAMAEGDTFLAFPAQISATEDHLFSGVVAYFSDTTYIDNKPADFSATIDWGDGRVDQGAVAAAPELGDGVFEVLGSHTWTQDDTFTVTVTVADDPPSTAPAVRILSTATVSESSDFTAQGVGTVRTKEGVLFSGPVATFADIGSLDSPSEYTASVDWGDGTAATTGSISGSNGTFAVTGSHVYLDEGTYSITVTVSEKGVRTPVRAGSEAVVEESDVLGGHMLLLTLVEGQTLSGPIALFSDTNLANTASDFTALIIWGDGSATSGTISGGNGFFIVSGSHIYGDEGTFPLSVTLADDGVSTAEGTTGADVTVAEADALTGALASLHPTEGQTFSGLVATFSDANTANVPGDFIATISWGDGSSSTGTVSGSGGQFTVSGTHTYADEGSYTVSVALADDPPGAAKATTTGTVTVAEGDTLAGTLASMHPIEGRAFSGAVATFTSTNTANTPADFLATVHWGDGSTSSGAVTGSNGSFTVSGTHTYADEGPYVVSVSLQDDAPGTASATASGSVRVAEADILTGTSAAISAVAGTGFSGTVATFSDTNLSNTAGDFIARINWGDGTTTAGAVSGGNGRFTVRGTHTYVLPGRYTVQTTLRDDPPGTTMATASGTVRAAIPVSSAGVAVLVYANNGCTAVVTSNINTSKSVAGTLYFQDQRPGGIPCKGQRAGVITFQSISVDAVVCTSHRSASIYGRAAATTYPSTTGQVVTFRADVSSADPTGSPNGAMTFRASNGYTSGPVTVTARLAGCR